MAHDILHIICANAQLKQKNTSLFEAVVGCEYALGRAITAWWAHPKCDHNIIMVM